ncbi:MAG TPA: AMP-binding protein [Thermoanaerobaculia bacterium]
MRDVSGRLAISRAEIEQTIPARFETVVQHVPDRLALRGGGQSWTYAELNRAVNRIAHALRACTPAGSGRIAYLVDQSPEMVLATLAVLKTGKTYVAIHPHLPPAAQREILADVAPDLLLTTPARERDARAIAAGLCDVRILGTFERHQPDGDPSPAAAPRDPSTLFYTSGSTGRPKGVVKSHRAVLHRVWLSSQYDAIALDDRQSLLTHCSFSASESDMFGALLQGAAVCTFDIASRDFSEFRGWLESEHITLLHPPVLFFRRFLSTLEPGHRFPDVRIVALAGDVVLPADLQQWRQHSSSDCAVLHRFSITEGALLTVSRFDGAEELRGTILEAGRPVPDKTLRLVDAQGAPVAPGETGELLVQSDYLADGYWNRPEETAAAFALDPATGRIYHTGDLGQFSVDGTFVFLGRRDDQVKIRGYRVELREIEAALMQLDGVREAACVAVKEDAEPRLHAFLVANDGRAPAPAAIRARLRVWLPEWKVPDDVHFVPALPATLTGKIDRKLLRELAVSPRSRTPVADGSDAAAGGEGCQRTILAIWSRVLRRPVGPDDAFFEDLGGSSLDALEIVNDISRVSGRHMPLSLLLELNTVRKMSGYLDAQPDRERTVIALQSGGSRPPVFCVSGKGGSVIAFRALARALGTGQPFYGITYHGISPEALPSTLAALAACYADAIREQQPDGPYYLAGYSAGGLIAFEVARQLARAGHPVAFIGLLDTSAAGERAPRWKVARKYGPIFLRRPAAFMVRLGRGLGWRASHFLQWARSGTWPAIPEPVENRFYQSLNLQASLQPWPAPVTLFLARQGTGAQSARRDAGWERLCSAGLSIVEIDGEHDTILTSDVGGLAAAFSTALSGARDAPRCRTSGGGPPLN